MIIIAWLMRNMGKNLLMENRSPTLIFITQIAFWCTGVKGQGNWIRTPGSRNPGQDITM